MGSVLPGLTLGLSSTEKENLKRGFSFSFSSPRDLMFSLTPKLISNTCLAFGYCSLLGLSSLRTQVLYLSLWRS